MKSEEAKQLKELEIEYRRLKRILAEAQLDKEILKEALEGNNCARRGVERRSRTFACARTSRSVGLVGFWVNGRLSRLPATPLHRPKP
jgi:hypothetical protein